MKRPAYLQKGDTIAIVAPAGIIKNNEHIHQAAKMVESWGLNVVIGKHVFDKYHHFSATDANRLTDLQEALDNPKIKAVWCARGGYGTVRIIDDLDFTLFKKSPKWIVGYSDITVLHNHLHNLGFESLHAMMPVNMEIPEQERANSVETFKKALFGEKLSYHIPANPKNVQGTIKGILVGGNLTILENLLGTNSSINTENKILFFEEIGEYKYHIDRLIRALERGGYFKNCKGLIIGGMTNLKKNYPSYGQSIEELILEITKKYDFPILFDLPSGHANENKALYLGREVKMVVGENSVSVEMTQ